MTDRLTTTATSIEIVLSLQELNGATLGELVSHLDIPKSTLHRHLSTLADYGFVAIEDREYKVGFRFLELGEHARNRKTAYQLAESPVRDLATETGERAQFVVEEQGMGVYLHLANGEHAVQTGLSVGRRIYLHSTAAGKIILANLPEERINEIIDEHGLPPATDNTITDSNNLKSRVSEIQKRGYAFNREEAIEGLHAVAVPVTGNDDQLIGVLSVSAPSNRMKGEWFESELPDLILGSANELELRIAYT